MLSLRFLLAVSITVGGIGAAPIRGLAQDFEGVPVLPDHTVPTPIVPAGDPGAPDEAIPALFHLLPFLQADPMGLPEGVERPAGKSRFRLRLSDGSLLVGEFAVDAKIKIKTRFAEISLPLKDVARIDPAADDKKWTVVLEDGDRLTGTVDFANVSLKTNWGEVPVKAENLLAIEAGMLYPQQLPFSRASADGRTTVTHYRASSWFEPAKQPPEGSPLATGVSNTIYPSTSYPSYSPQPTYQAPMFQVPMYEEPMPEGPMYEAPESP